MSDDTGAELDADDLEETEDADFREYAAEQGESFDDDAEGPDAAAPSVDVEEAAKAERMRSTSPDEFEKFLAWRDEFGAAADDEAEVEAEPRPMPAFMQLSDADFYKAVRDSAVSDADREGMFEQLGVGDSGPAF